MTMPVPFVISYALIFPSTALYHSSPGLILIMLIAYFCVPQFCIICINRSLTSKQMTLPKLKLYIGVL